MTISKYYELQLPRSKSVDGVMKWVVRLKRLDLAYYLCNDGSYDIANLFTNSDSLFYFDSENDAHLHAHTYCINHEMLYPYIFEYKQAMKAAYYGSLRMTFD